MQILQLEHNIITGSQYTLKSAQETYIKNTSAPYKQKMKASTHPGKNPMLHKNTRLLKKHKKNAKEFYLVLGITIDYKIEMPVVFDKYSLTQKRKRFDKIKTTAIKAARLEKQAKQLVPTISEPLQEPLPLNLYANAYQHTVTKNENEIVFACSLKRTNAR